MIHPALLEIISDMEKTTNTAKQVKNKQIFKAGHEEAKITVLQRKKEKYKENKKSTLTIQETIRLFLCDRFLNGYTLSDKKYDIMVAYFVNKIKNCKNDEAIPTLLQEYIGPYNSITAHLYVDVVTRHLYNKKKVNPSTAEIYNIL